jgi:hypothetical protein
MNWDLGLDRTVSRLIPSFLRNPKMYQWLRALLFPLESINEEFKLFAAVKKRESLMSSQVDILESYLNELYSSNFADPSETIQIVHGIEEAQGTYYDAETPPPNPPYLDGHMVVYSEGETPASGKESPFIFYDYEEFGTLPEDFRLLVPSSVENNEAVTRGITSTVDNYVIDMKKYDVVYVQ